MRRAEREARRSERTPAPANSTKDEVESPEQPASTPRRPAGRRVFEPPGQRSGASKGRSASRPVRSSESKAPSAPKKLSPEMIAKQQETARRLAADKGIPPVHALRVVRGEVSLNIVLKNLMRKERATRLIERDGLEPGLAGQVASGHLSRQRALELQRIRIFRKHRIDRDALKLAEISGASVGVGCFDGSWASGNIVEARTYDFDLAPLDGGKPMLIQKHDVKLVCGAESMDRLRDIEVYDETIRGAGLAGTSDRAERVRPTDARLLQLIDSQEEVVCVLRDGSSCGGRVHSFGRWDMAIEVDGVGEVTILFHALHKSNTWIL
ncbi:MAG: hypothetical protein QF464_11635 [Myxococcota bacterium]|nr:hypothetical protein [Myxococcota bacterium]